MAYRPLVTGEVMVWCAATVLSRLPVAMAPLALVFLARNGPGGYAFGAVLAATYAVAEAAGAPVLGSRLDRRAMRTELCAGLLVGATAFALLATRPSALATAALAALAGFAASGAPGGMRTLLSRVVHKDDVASAFSIESVLNQLVWALSPALVSVLALSISARLPFLLAAISMAVAGAVVCVIRAAGRRPATETETPGPLVRTLWTAWPIYLTSAAAMYLLATVELLLPSLLEHRGIAVAWSGPLLTGFAAASVAGGLLYGARRWPGRPRVQSLVLLMLIAGFIALTSALPRLPGIAIALCCAGLMQAGLLTARNLSLRERLPEYAHAGGYSVMYAGSGIGYGVSGAAAGILLAVGTPSSATAAGALGTVLLGVLSAAAERRQTRDRIDH